jgi:glycosyltransferase involved in cell wall biosynthesis
MIGIMASIDILTSDGSPLGVGLSSVYGDEFRKGVGGAELALLTMCETWHGLGHKVRLYNDPDPRTTSPFEQYPINSFDPSDDRDVVIVFRSPNMRVVAAEGLKVWWSTDQYTVGNFKEFAPYVDKIVCISEFHQDHFKAAYQIEDTVAIDLPVRLTDYQQDVEKVPYRFIFSSVPDRGLDSLWRMWPRILNEFPEASLVITSDYRLWGNASPGNQSHMARWLTQDNISFLSCMPREEFVIEQLKAEVHLYPCIYEELFCISVAESQVAGAYPITSNCGALPGTNMAAVVLANANDPRSDTHFVQAVIDTLDDRELFHMDRETIQREAIDRFNPLRIVQEWDEKVFK